MTNRSLQICKLLVLPLFGERMTNRSLHIYKLRLYPCPLSA